MSTDGALREEMLHALRDNLLPHWYPLVIDKKCGGYFTNITYDWKLEPAQEKMIVSQARHVWTASKVAEYMGLDDYCTMADHGFRFLRDVMWDKQYGGFYQIRSREGGASEVNGWRDEKRTYGNAFAVYSMAALFGLTRNPEVLAEARKAFTWIEERTYDPVHKGYYQFITREGNPFDRSSTYKSIASDANEVGYKDQNSSIHLLEAYTELLSVWDNPKLREQLAMLLTLIRDTMTDQRGFLQLFFQDDWSPLSFRDASEEVRKANFGLDHISFGHDYETAFLMLEASHVLGIKDDVRTLTMAKKMLDHALANGWDRDKGGFYDGGYYCKGETHCTIVKDTKNWWAQAEGLNALLLFSRIFPQGGYRPYFDKQWEYVKQYILDPNHGDWFEGGIDKEPHFKTGPKSHMWKCTYHTGRALMNCAVMLSETIPSGAGEGYTKKHNEFMQFVEHWKKVAHAGIA